LFGRASSDLGRGELRRKSLHDELIQPFRSSQVLQTVEGEVTQHEIVGQIRLDEGSSGVRNQDLAAVPSSRDARCPMNVHADVIIAGESALSGMQTHPHAKRTWGGMCGERPLDPCGGLGRSQSAREHHEEGVALRAYFDSIVFQDRVPDDATVLLEEFDVALPQLLEEPGRPLNIGEEERDGARW
jgi:hypothetical protein